jgi:hypothetical protein
MNAEVIRNLLTVVQNPHNDPNAIRSAHKTLDQHRGHPDVDAYFARLAVIAKDKVTRARIAKLSKIF